MESTPKFWAYRIDKSQREYFSAELQEGRLRQGWGWDEKQTLSNLQMDGGAKRNLPIFHKVKEGDVLLIPGLPTHSEVIIVKATQDFDRGYDFSFSEGMTDYGHIFPAEKIKCFERHNKFVSGSIRSTLKNPSRFWSINHCAKDINRLIQSKEMLNHESSYESRFDNILTKNLNAALNDDFFTGLLADLNKNFSNEEWEFALVQGLKRFLPEPILVERVAGREEKNHGTDILITLPGILGRSYGIALQVKDYEGSMNSDAIKQVLKAYQYEPWNTGEMSIIDAYVLVTKCSIDDHEHLRNLEELDQAHTGENKRKVKVVFAEEFLQLFKQVVESGIGVSTDQ
ncbi:hypothetical protein BCT06_14140 [Vibrio breoganii]|uniref:hypothetical protein n=1 Tax=Vibrio breoganii TaxID=553239 RepID=UPI000C8354B0|nr:hypothetical protein [Vibrio breoganii]PMI15796.1 hypothetical protein BCU49_15430 [Vibrio breoganii]PMO59805.1 hypothetical protein BCT06_14140 [Vibrio breoganii]